MAKQSSINTSLGQYYLQQLMNQGQLIGAEQYGTGKALLGEAKGDIDYLQDFFKNILEGNNKEQLLDFVDTQGIDDSYANAELAATELAPRGGVRASTLGNLSFSKAGDVQRMLQMVKQQSPNALMQLAQMLGGLGGTAFQQSQAGFGLNMQAALSALEIDQRGKDRKNQLIGGIIASAGAVGGALAGKL